MKKLFLFLISASTAGFSFAQADGFSSTVPAPKLILQFLKKYCNCCKEPGRNRYLLEFFNNLIGRKPGNKK